MLLIADDRGRYGFDAEPAEAILVQILWEVDEKEEETGRVAGLEVIDFSRFKDWGGLPKLDLLWQLPGWEPLPLDKLLKRFQKELRQRKAQDAA